MKAQDVALIEYLLPEDRELQELWEEHQQLEAELDRLRDQRFLTPSEEVRQRELRKIKLAGRDRIHEILRGHRQARP